MYGPLASLHVSHPPLWEPCPCYSSWQPSEQLAMVTAAWPTTPRAPEPQSPMAEARQLGIDESTSQVKLSLCPLRSVSWREGELKSLEERALGYPPGSRT